MTVDRVISGGQTGVDRAALDVAIELSIPHGGSCPLGRRAEDGVIPSRYELRETESSEYHVRTKRNVQDADGTLIVFRGQTTGGTQRTRQLAHTLERPYWLIDLSEPVNLSSIRTWLTEYRIAVLNVAGPRESSEPGIYDDARKLLRELLEPG